MRPSIEVVQQVAHDLVEAHMESRLKAVPIIVAGIETYALVVVAPTVEGKPTENRMRVLALVVTEPFKDIMSKSASWELANGETT